MLIIGNNANCMSKYNLSTYCTIIYRIILINVEQARKYSDSGALDNSAFGQAITWNYYLSQLVSLELQDLSFHTSWLATKSFLCETISRVEKYT